MTYSSSSKKWVVFFFKQKKETECTIDSFENSLFSRGFFLLELSKALKFFFYLVRERERENTVFRFFLLFKNFFHTSFLDSSL